MEAFESGSVRVPIPGAGGECESARLRVRRLPCSPTHSAWTALPDNSRNRNDSLLLPASGGVDRLLPMVQNLQSSRRTGNERDVHAAPSPLRPSRLPRRILLELRARVQRTVRRTAQRLLRSATARDRPYLGAGRGRLMPAGAAVVATEADGSSLPVGPWLVRRPPGEVDDAHLGQEPRDCQHQNENPPICRGGA